MTPLVTQTAKQATQLILTCIIAGLFFWAVYGIVRVFSPPPSVPVPAAQAGAGRINELVVKEIP